MDTPEVNPQPAAPAPDLPPEHAAFVHLTDADLSAAASVKANVAQLDAAPTRPAAAPPSPAPSGSLASQIGGTHYTKLKIQPLTFSMKNELGFVEGSVCKYVTRWRDKGGIQDLEKALDLLTKYVAHLHDEAAEALRNPT